MIKIILRNKERETKLVDLLHSDLIPKGRVFVSFPIKGMTKKVRGGKMYRVINSHI